jgi:ornithine carbamoyltransferase
MDKPHPGLPRASATSTMVSDKAFAAQALALKRAEGAGLPLPRLGRAYFGLVCDDPRSPEAELFQRAATALGGRVAHLRPAVAHLDQDGDVPSTAQWLGRIYDGVECQGLPPERVAQIRSAAGVPVFDCLSGQRNTVAMQGLLDEGTDELEARRYVVQAVLLSLFS